MAFLLSGFYDADSFLSLHPSMAVIFSLFPNVHFPLYFLKRRSRFFSLNFFSSCWWIVLKIVNPQGIPKAQGGVLLCWPWEVGGSHRGEWGGTQHHLACLPHPYPVHLTHSFLWRWSQAVELEELYCDHDDNDHSMAKITVSGLPKRLWLALSPTGCLFLNFLHDLEVTYVFETQVILFCLFWRWCSVNVLLNNIISWSFYKCPKIIWKLCVCVCVCVCVCACARAGSLVTDSFCNPMDCSLSGSFVHGISQVRILEWIAPPFSKGSSLPRDQSGVFCVSCLAERILHQWATCVFSDFQI